jgi:hypothetical protein
MKERFKKRACVVYISSGQEQQAVAQIRHPDPCPDSSDLASFLNSSATIIAGGTDGSNDAVEYTDETDDAVEALRRSVAEGAVSLL